MDDFGGMRTWLWAQVKYLKPSFMSKEPHFNFISVHYMWVIGLALLGSVIIYGSKNSELAYIDALVFATGANTQAGLNTVDVSNLNTFQQAVIYVLAAMTNPITINSFVVFLRLYWFEKRFQHVVREARARRGTISKSKAKFRDDADFAERGVNGRNITVNHGQRSRITNDGIVLANGDQDTANGGLFMTGGKLVDSSEDIAPTVSPPSEHQEARNTEISFAQTVNRDGYLERMKLPSARTSEEHIAILERQRKGDDEVLRIPGPRDFERGMAPKRVQDGDEEEPERVRRMTTDLSTDGQNESTPQQNNNPQGRQQTIMIEEPDRQRRTGTDDTNEEDWVDDARAFANAFSFLKFPKLFKKKDNASASNSRNKRRETFSNLKSAFSRERDDGTPYLSWEPTLGRNSAFPDLDEEQREELGGIEYRSLKTLAGMLTIYFWGFSALGVVCLLPWILNVDSYGKIVDNINQSRTWWGFFTPHSAFMDLGFTLTPDSMNSFNTAVLPMILMSFLIIIGNTGFPVMLRFMIWVASKIVPHGTGLYEELMFLLDHPRRCFTLLFPSGATWWLFWLLVILNGIDLIFFIVLDIGSGPINEYPAGIKILDGLFQAASTRTAGFSCVNLALLHPAVQVSYMIMMYISVFPIAISVRRTNVYEEKSLGIYSHGEMDEQNLSDLAFVGAHLRRQLSFDLWYIFIGFFILSISEGQRLIANDFSMFAVLFEVVSAYGTVGMSLGYSGLPASNASLCAQFSVVGKLVIAAMMIRGRHRGLPYGLDRAILLPSESLNAKDQEDAEMRARLVRIPTMQRRNSALSVATGLGHPGPAFGGSHTRQKSLDRTNSNILASFLHPGPSIPPMTPPTAGFPRRSTDEAGSPLGTTVTGVSRRFSKGVDMTPPQEGISWRGPPRRDS